MNPQRGVSYLLTATPPVLRGCAREPIIGNADHDARLSPGLHGRRKAVSRHASTVRATHARSAAEGAARRRQAYRSPSSAALTLAAHTEPSRFDSGLPRLSAALANRTPFLASSNLLILRASNNRTETAVVRLRERKGLERDGKRPEMGFGAGARSSDKSPRRPAFCAVPADAVHREKNVANGQTGGATGSVVKPSPGLFQ